MLSCGCPPPVLPQASSSHGVSESGVPYQDAKKDRNGTFLICEVPIPDFRAALVDWLAFIRDQASAAEPGAASDPAGL